MNPTTEFQFLNPLWLLLLVPLGLLLWAYIRGAGRGSNWSRLCDPHLLAQMVSRQAAPSSQVAAAWIIGALLALGIIAAAAPSWSRLSLPTLESHSARVIVLDLSKAMLVQDIRPNRYQHAVAAASELIADDFDGETGLVVFAGAAFVLSPLSRDADTLQAFVEAVSPETMPQPGSNLAAAIEQAQELLEASLSGQGQILLISAGDSDDSAALRAAANAADSGHRVSVLAIGSSAGGPLLDKRGGLLRDANGAVRLSRSNLSLLQGIATAGRGAMMTTTADKRAGDILSTRLDANRLVTAAGEPDDRSGVAADDGIWLLWLMLPLSLLLFRKNLLLVLPLVLALPVGQDVYAAESGTFWKNAEWIAFEAYQSGDFETAIETSRDPGLRGAAYYRRGQFAEALEQFDKPQSADSLYNRANTLVQLQRYSDAIAAYQLALEIDPTLESAAYNQRLLEEFLQQQSALQGENGEADGDPAGDFQSQDSANLRIGIATEFESNPADAQQVGPGTGAGEQSGQVDPMERFDGRDSEQARFVPRAQSAELELPTEFIERWISGLPETSTELYTRKFLRDYHRQQRQLR